LVAASVGLDWPTSIVKLSCWLLWPWELPREMLALKSQTAIDALHVDFKKHRGTLNWMQVG
jgi:hypothetical protein